MAQQLQAMTLEMDEVGTGEQFGLTWPSKLQT